MLVNIHNFYLNDDRFYVSYFWSTNPEQMCAAFREPESHFTVLSYWSCFFCKSCFWNFTPESFHCEENLREKHVNY